MTTHENNSLSSLFDFDKLSNKTITFINKKKNKTKTIKLLDNLSNATKETYKWCGELKSISDLLNLYQKNIELEKSSNTTLITNINIHKLEQIIKPLQELNNMIGLSEIKNNIFNHIIFYLQDLDEEFKDMHHTVIKGPPGVGKTCIANILADIYRGLGVLEIGKVVKVRREDLIAGYLGQTGEKTKKKLEEAKGNVLLFDEAYSLGSGSSNKQDSYAQEAIDQITWFLSEHGHEFICIIAGYKEELEQRFFAMNPGLARRFPIHYEIKDYTPKEMTEILKTTINANGWQHNLKNTGLETLIKDNKEHFPHYGGDLHNLFVQMKKYHSKRLLEIDDLEKLKESRKILNNDDLLGGMKIYKKINGYNINEDKTYLNYYN